jgi:hypothetical protein
MNHIKNIALAKTRKHNIPHTLQGKLWSADVRNLDLNDDKNYIIHQILMYGSLDEIGWLFAAYSKKEILAVFTKYPKKIYSLQGFNFIKNFILRIKNIHLDENKYLKTTPRVIGR